jgi:anti-anti-sigma factor
VLQDRSRPYVAVDANRDQGIVTITLRGELDSTARSALSEHLTKHLAEYRAQLSGTQPRQLVIDMAEVDFLDWAAAAVIFTAARMLLPAGGKPVMRSPGRPVRRLLEKTGLDQQCEVDPDDRPSTRRVRIPLPRKAQHSQPHTPRLRREVTSPRICCIPAVAGRGQRTAARVLPEWRLPALPVLLLTAPPLAAACLPRRPTSCMLAQAWPAT